MKKFHLVLMTDYHLCLVHTLTGVLVSLIDESY